MFSGVNITTNVFLTGINNDRSGCNPACLFIICCQGFIAFISRCIRTRHLQVFPGFVVHFDVIY